MEPFTGRASLLSVAKNLGWNRARKAAEKVTGTICRNGPEGASHKWRLSPFPRAVNGCDGV
jgi:hypothetical protein